ncbi:hypothetical protein C8R47DRAFT_1064176 [Mycena vitilis]|nr:hypothetical protein C8R47DRAFT_1064176 [Mycena vitilis]
MLEGREPKRVLPSCSAKSVVCPISHSQEPRGLGPAERQNAQECGGKSAGLSDFVATGHSLSVNRLRFDDPPTRAGRVEKKKTTNIKHELALRHTSSLGMLESIVNGSRVEQKILEYWVIHGEIGAQSQSRRGAARSVWPQDIRPPTRLSLTGSCEPRDIAVYCGNLDRSVASWQNPSGRTDAGGAQGLAVPDPEQHSESDSVLEATQTSENSPGRKSMNGGSDNDSAWESEAPQRLRREHSAHPTERAGVKRW